MNKLRLNTEEMMEHLSKLNSESTAEELTEKENVYLALLNTNFRESPDFRDAIVCFANVYSLAVCSGNLKTFRQLFNKLMTLMEFLNTKTQALRVGAQDDSR